MAYRDNVTAMATKMGISNDPGLREEDLNIHALHFYQLGSGRFWEVGATDMNRGGRLFFQYHTFDTPAADHSDGKYVFLPITDELRHTAKEYFAETWDDNPDENRRLLYGICHFNVVKIFRKKDQQ